MAVVPAIADNDLPIKPLTPAEQKSRVDYHHKHDAIATIHLKAVPSDLPTHVMPGSEFTTGESMRRGNGEKSILLNFSSTQEMTSAVDWYDKALRNDGYKVKVTFTKSGKPDFIIAYKEKTSITVHFMDSAIKNGKAPAKHIYYTLTTNQPNAK